MFKRQVAAKSEVDNELLLLAWLGSSPTYLPSRDLWCYTEELGAGPKLAGGGGLPHFGLSRRHQFNGGSCTWLINLKKKLYIESTRSDKSRLYMDIQIRSVYDNFRQKKYKNV